KCSGTKGELATTSRAPPAQPHFFHTYATCDNWQRFLFFTSLRIIKPRVNLRQSGRQADAVSDLYSQTWPCVCFQQHRAFPGVDDDVDADIAKTNRLGSAARHIQHLAPIGHTPADDRQSCVGMAFASAVAKHGMVGESRCQIHARADPT